MRSFSDIMIKNVLGNNTVSSAIGTRFYYGQLATVKNTLFPCADFDASGTNVERIQEFQLLNFRLWTWSGKSQDQAWDIYDAIRVVLIGNPLTDTPITAYVMCVEEAKPIFNYDNTDECYYFMGNWTASLVRV